jgi:hypothetical protein
MRSTGLYNLRLPNTNARMAAFKPYRIRLGMLNQPEATVPFSCRGSQGSRAASTPRLLPNWNPAQIRKIDKPTSTDKGRPTRAANSSHMLPCSVTPSRALRATMPIISPAARNSTQTMLKP